ncbi:class I SAM-dependent methyltransferase [Streptomyces sp. NPDC094143]|uniref:class I SAM-dependent methyltransferase n=1 Tax=Streptomyces sp. NPDC094143 TaxID=3155310 RepID=UPI00332D5FE0
MSEVAAVLARGAAYALGEPLPLRVRAWDGSEAGPQDGPALVLHNQRALRHLLWQPDELGLVRAWVTGDLEISGDLYEALDRIAGLLWERDEDPSRFSALTRAATLLRTPGAVSTLGRTLALAGRLRPPPRPAEEVVRRRGRAHTRGRDRAAISHHYDVGNDFYALVLGPSMVYSCAYWDSAEPSPDASLEKAQSDKLDLICRKLAIEPGQRLLDVGCGWGSMALHAAMDYGAEVVGVTISEEQAALARERVSNWGMSKQVEIRVQDYRDVTDGPYDAISSIGMAEHVGADQYRAYAAHLHTLLRPGGRLLNHQIARRPLRDEESYRINAFIDRYVFPDGELAPVGSTVSLLEAAGFEVRDVEALREHYAVTLRAWVANLEANWSQAVRLVGEGRARVWRLYMAASALGFQRNTMGVNQILAVRTATDGTSGMPLVRTFGERAFSMAT